MDHPEPSPQGQLAREWAHFSAVLRPYRSLSPRGFVILMACVGGVGFAAGMVFFMMGAWPVLGFFGLDVALVYVAFRLNYYAGRLHETVDLTDDSLTVTRVRPSGRRQSWSFHPYWVRIELTPRPGRASELSLSLHGRRLVFGAFLTEQEKSEIACALKDALIARKGGVRV